MTYMVYTTTKSFLQMFQKNNHLKAVLIHIITEMQLLKYHRVIN